MTANPQQNPVFPPPSVQKAELWSHLVAAWARALIRISFWTLATTLFVGGAITIGMIGIWICGWFSSLMRQALGL